MSDCRVRPFNLVLLGDEECLLIVIPEPIICFSLPPTIILSTTLFSVPSHYVTHTGILHSFILKTYSLLPSPSLRPIGVSQTHSYHLFIFASISINFNVQPTAKNKENLFVCFNQGSPNPSPHPKSLTHRVHQIRHTHSFVLYIPEYSKCPTPPPFNKHTLIKNFLPFKLTF